VFDILARLSAAYPKACNVNTLRISLSDWANSPTMTVRAIVDEASIRPEGATPLGLSSVTVDGVLTRIDTELFFQGTVSGVLETTCDRCLGPATISLSQDVEWYFEPKGSVAADSESEVDLEFDDEEIEDVKGTMVRIYDGESVDLGPGAWEELVLAVPSKILCREDCAGLCPTCGANRNEGPCSCDAAAPAGHPGMAKLKDIFPDLPDSVEE
jgi:uncharacterized metal-binding protein YceD (DUF177 family)